MNKPNAAMPFLPQSRQAGLSLIELMVSLGIGLFLIGGVITVFGKTSDLYRTNESAARVQETARYAMSTIEADLREANFWGLHNNADLIDNAAPLDPASFPDPAPAYSLPGALSPYAAEISSCGDMWAVKLAAYVEAVNDGYGLDCGAFSATVAGSDQLTIRRASTVVMNDAARLASGGRIKVQTSRVQGTLFTDTNIPAGYLPPLSETHALVVHGYYVAQDSDEAAGVPSLRRKSLEATGGAPVIVDEQIVPNVEDLQVELGVDRDGDQNADFFVPADAAIAGGEAIVAMRVWLMVRAEQAEPGFTDDRVYDYADRSGAAAYAPGDRFRRLLVSKTIALRNTRR